MSVSIARAAALCLLLASAPSFAAEATAPPAQGSAPAPASSLSPEDARRAVAVLEDDSKRADAITALRAIAQVSPAAASSSAAPAASAVTPAGAAASPTASAAAPAATTAPLESDGLIARMLRRMGHWVDGLAGQLKQMRGATTAFPHFFADVRHSVASDANQSLLLKLLVVMGSVFLAGLVLEWGLHRALRRPRQALVAHADAADEAAPVSVAPAPPARDAETTWGPAGDAIALVRTQRDGVERVEAVPVSAGDGGSGGDMAGAATAATATAATPVTPPPPKRPDSSGAHLRTFRHLPYAFATLVLDLLPAGVFFLVAGLLVRWLAAGEPRVADITVAFINAYVTVRIGMALVRVLVSPEGHGLRLVKMGQRTARLVMTYTRSILVVAAFGLAFAEATRVLGGDGGEREAIIKLVSLVVHLLVVTLIFRTRRPVSAWIAGPREAVGPLAMARHWLSDVWAFVAAVVIMGLWVVWALGVENGFTKLLHFVGGTAAVIVVARVIAVLLLGAVGRVFQPAASTDAAGRIDVHRYYALARGVVTFVLVVASAVALFQVWGFHALSWFSRGTIGRSLASAGLTILVAAIVAIVIWEFVNAGANRRLDRWTTQGDLVRAARLRTLLPMLRTCLLVVMVLIVGLTALSQIGINTAPLLAGASIIGVALGFGSQKLVQDFITGIFLLMENAMQVGDWVTVGSVSGSVEYLSIRTVRLRGGDGSLYIVPFSSVTIVNNTNRGIGNAAVKIGVTYDTDIQRVIAEIKQIGADLRDDPKFRDQILSDIEVWGVDAVDGSTIALSGQMRCTDKGRWGVQREINRRMAERFRAAGIAVANPQATVLLAPGAGAGEGGDAAVEA